MSVNTTSLYSNNNLIYFLVRRTQADTSQTSAFQHAGSVKFHAYIFNVLANPLVSNMQSTGLAYISEGLLTWLSTLLEIL